MLTDKTLLFFENVVAATGEGTLEINGPAAGKIFCTINGQVTALSLDITTADTEAGLGTAEALATHTATAEEIAKGVMSFCVPNGVKRFVKLEAAITGAPKAIATDPRTRRVTGGLTAGYIPMVDQDGYIAPDMLELIK